MTLPFFSPKYVEHEVADSLQKFYPNRVFIIGKLRDFLKPLFKALSTLTADHATDINRESVETKDGDSYQLKTNLGAIDTKLALQRAQERVTAIEKLTEDLTSPPAMRAIGYLVMDSLREHFDKRPTDQDVNAFLEEVPIETLMQMLKGVAKANKEVFGPLGQQVEAALSQFSRRLSRAAPVADPAPQSEPSAEPPVEPKETTSTSSGSA